MKSKIDPELKKILDADKLVCREFKLFAASIKTEPTRKTYYYSLDCFMEFADFKSYARIKELDTKKLVEMLQDYTLSLSHLARGSVNVRLSAVELFLKINMITYHQLPFRSLIKNDEIKPAGEKPYTTKEIQQMLKVTNKLRSIALILFFSSTAARPGAIQDQGTGKFLKKGDFEEFPDGCMCVTIYEGTTSEYSAFLTPESSDAIKLYWNEREQANEILNDESPAFANFLTSLHAKNTHLSYIGVHQIMIPIIKHAGITRKLIRSNRYDKSEVYGMRKRWDTIVSDTPNFSRNAKESMMNHDLGLEGHYYKPTPEKLFKSFRLAIKELTISDEQRVKAELLLVKQTNDERETLQLQITEINKKLRLVSDDKKEETRVEISPEKRDQIIKVLAENNLSLKG